MNPIRLAFALGAALLAAACLPVTSKSPVGTTAGLGADPALIGTWKGQVEKDEPAGYFHFLRAGDGSLTAVLVSTGEAAGTKSGDWSVYAVRTAALGGRHFLNVRAVSDNGKPAEGGEAVANIPLLYEMAPDGTLALYLIDEKAAKEAIAAGRIEGTVEGGDYGDVTLTASPEKLDAFFAGEEGAALFKEKLVTLTKVE